MRERRPGVWEIRIAAGTDPATGRTLQRSVTFRGTEADASTHREALAAQHVAQRSLVGPSPRLTVAELLERWLEADQPWKPSTTIGYQSTARFLRAEPLARQRVVDLTPRLVRSVIAGWEAHGASRSVVSGRFRVLRAAIGWAYDERVIDAHPLRHMRGPSRAEPRRPIADDHLTSLLQVAEVRVLEGLANAGSMSAARARLHRVEQDLLLVRLAADSGARRGELAALRFADLHGRVLTVARNISGEVVTTPKSGRARSLTLGRSTTQLWRTLEQQWGERVDGDLGPWVFSAAADHHRRLSAGALGHRFTRLRDAAGTDATLHRLRHNVATFLVARGDILHAQARLGHADAATTLREYAHALPLADIDVADAIDAQLDERLTFDLDGDRIRRPGRRET